MDTELEKLRTELNELRRRYTKLEEEKREIERRYAEDYQKWRRFKEWLLRGGGKGKSSARKAKDDSTPETLEKSRGKENESHIIESPRAPDEADAMQGSVAGPSKLPAKPSSPTIKSPSPSHTNRIPQPATEPRQGSERMVDDKDASPLSPKRRKVVSVNNSPRGPIRTPISPTLNKGKSKLMVPLSPSNKSLNSRYRLNPVLNDGVAYQFEEVVRQKDARRALHAEDCECCRDYYNAIAPLPLAAQPPLWRSPPTTPQKRSRYIEDEEMEFEVDANETATASHMRKISRHRRRWEAPKTPPGYWDIGFPDTQQTERINERAREMHAQKIRNAEIEARAGGRYIRR
ncbi:hypothetical protein BDW22DRAFT_1383329 [Trametopsis cervina]|nr:hypothetical protein BDW22DRAFT_1383329 [Trametopsis cervina]